MKAKDFEDVKGTEVLGCTIKIMASGDMLDVAYIKVPPGVDFPPHSHPEECVGYVLSGELELYTDKHPEKVIVQSGNTQLYLPDEKVGGRNPGNIPAEFLLIEPKTRG
jgi:quercetin dioxygenase-like cupin family protein